MPSEAESQAVISPACQWMPFEDAVEYVGCVSDKLRAAIELGRIHFLRLGNAERLIRYKRHDLDLLIREFRSLAETGWSPNRDSSLAVQAGWTYFIHAPEFNRIKIGRSDVHPNLRLSSLRTGSPTELVGLGVIRDSSLERSIQARFSRLRWRYEWFHAEPVLMEFVRDISEPWPVAYEGRDQTINIYDFHLMKKSTRDRIEAWCKSHRLSRRLPRARPAKPGPNP
jgi:hypothetical protein